MRAKIMYGAIALVLVVIALAACGGGGSTDMLTADTDALETLKMSAGKGNSPGGGAGGPGSPFGDVHEQHSGIVNCLDCHTVHGGMMGGWLMPTDETCLGCHEAHNPSMRGCIECHYER